MYAIIETGGKQYKVENGTVLFIEKLDVEPDTEITFDKVLALSSKSGIMTGTPYIAGASVTGTVVKNGKAKKITVFTYKPKKNEKRKLGHRQPYTMVRFDDIGETPGAGKSEKTAKPPRAKKAAAETVTTAAPETAPEATPETAQE